MSVRPRHAAVASLLLVASLPASAALVCRSAVYGGSIEFRCSQPETVISSCRWTALLTNAAGASGMRQGTFEIGPLAKDQLVVKETKFDGKQITSGTVKLDGCAINVVGTAASAAAATSAARAAARAAAASAAGTASRRTAPRAPPRSASAA